VLLRLGGATFLTDPVFGDLFGIVVRHDPPGIALGDLPHIDAILISHGHVDHLDPWTLGRLDHAATVVVPAGLEPRVRELGFGDVHGLRVWETVRVRGVRVTAVPAQHTRRSLGYLVGDGPTVYFAGDTGLFDGMGAIGDSARIDLALLPIGGYRPVLGLIPRPARALRRMHMTPDDVPAAAALLRPRLIVPIHWGTFRITAEPPDEPAARLRSIVAERGLGEAVRILAPGETLAF
jgi:L-ascorbate metabolism protein UlaG (beta-lactamase superfamily)